jgi:rRNA-processing protein FCF1
VGTYDQNLVDSFKRVSSYNRTDFDLLIQFLARRKLHVTPGVLAEVSNLAMQLKRDGFERMVEYNISELRRMDEHYVPKDVILEATELTKIGVTDTSLLIAAKKHDVGILTDDHPLWSRCMTEGIPATHMAELQGRADLF